MKRVNKAIILAAGKSTRYGKNKLVDPILGKSTIEYCIEFCIENKIKYFEGGAQGEHELARGFEQFDNYSNHYIAQPDFRVAISNFLNDELSRIDNYNSELEDRTPYKKI